MAAQLDQSQVNQNTETNDNPHGSEFDQNINMLDCMAGYMVARKIFKPGSCAEDFTLFDLIDEFSQYQDDVRFLSPMIHRAAAFIFDEPSFECPGSRLPFYASFMSENEADELMSNMAEQLRSQGLKAIIT